MKFFIATILASIAIAVSADTEPLFASAGQNQLNAVDLQRSVTDYAIRVRTAVPRVLSIHANGTINHVEVNVAKLLAQERSTRDAIFSLSSTSCVTNLRVLLNGITEFTGFESSNCVARYDLSLSELIQKKYGEVAAYEKAFGDAMRIVPGSFSLRNMFLEADTINADFSSRLTSLRNSWNAETKNIGEFEEKFGEDIQRLGATLQGCFNNIQVAVNPTYAIITNEIATCRNFDNSHDPFAFLQ